MTTRRRVVLSLAAFLGTLASGSYAGSADDRFEDARHLLEHGRSLRKCIGFLEDSIRIGDTLDKELYLLGAIAGRLASLVNAIAEWDIFAQEKSNLERKIQAGSVADPEHAATLVRPVTPDGAGDFDPSLPDSIREIHDLAEKVNGCSAKIDAAGASVDVDKLHFYVSTLILLNQSFRSLSGKHVANDPVRDQLYGPKKILGVLDRILEKAPDHKQAYILKAIVPCLPILRLDPASERIQFPLSHSGVPAEMLRDSLNQLDEVTKSDKRQSAVYLFKALIAFPLDKNRALLELGRFIDRSPPSAVLCLFKAELLFDLSGANPLRTPAADTAFQQMGVGSSFPMTLDFKFDIPVHTAMRVCSGFLNWRSALVLPPILSQLFSYTGHYPCGIKPEEFVDDDLEYAGDVMNLGIRVADAFVDYQPSTWRDRSERHGCLLMALVNVYSAYDIVKKSNRLIPTDAKSAFLDRYTAVWNRAKLLDERILQ